MKLEEFSIYGAFLKFKDKCNFFIIHREYVYFHYFKNFLFVSLPAGQSCVRIILFYAIFFTTPNSIVRDCKPEDLQMP